MNRWQRFWKKREMEEQLDRELRFHFDCQVADNIREGMSEAEARRQARLKFGGLEGTKEECRSARGTVWVDATVQDVRFALRTLRKSPAFTVAAIGTLALGIGANTAIFQLLDAVRLRSLPVPDAQQLARIQVKNGNGGWGISSDGYGLTYPLWDEVRNHQQAFSSVFAWDSGELRAGEGAQAQRMRALRVSGEFFPALRLPPAAGRLFSSDDDQRGCTGPGVILSYGLWQSEFAGRTSAVGSRLIVQGHPFTVVGVAPAMFSGLEVGSKFDIAMPLCAEGILQTGRPFDRRDVFWLRVRSPETWLDPRAGLGSSAVDQLRLDRGHGPDRLFGQIARDLQEIPAGSCRGRKRNQLAKGAIRHFTMAAAGNHGPRAVDRMHEPREPGAGARQFAPA
jgi:putative ABC transport system permease protein